MGGEIIYSGNPITPDIIRISENMTTKDNENICQSCGLSTESHERGTNADGTPSDEYCDGCFTHGEFIEPEITLKEMIENSVPSTAESRNMTLEEAKKYLETLLPTLRRWR